MCTRSRRGGGGGGGSGVVSVHGGGFGGGGGIPPIATIMCPVCPERGPRGSAPVHICKELPTGRVHGNAPRTIRDSGSFITVVFVHKLRHLSHCYMNVQLIVSTKWMMWKK